MSRIKLYNIPTIEPDRGDLVQLSFQEGLDAISQYDEENGTTELEFSEELVDHVPRIIADSMTASRSLTEVAYMVAPLANEARASDVAFVRNVASTAAANLGIPEAELFAENDVVEEGQALVLEGFKQRAQSVLMGIVGVCITTLEIAGRLFKASLSSAGSDINEIVVMLGKVQKGSLICRSGDYRYSDGKDFHYLVPKKTDDFTLNNVIKNFENAKKHYDYAMTLVKDSGDFLNDVSGELKSKLPSEVMLTVSKALTDLLSNVPKEQASGITYTIEGLAELKSAGKNLDKIVAAIGNLDLTREKEAGDYTKKIEYFDTNDLKSARRKLEDGATLFLEGNMTLGSALLMTNMTVRAMRAFKHSYADLVDKSTSKLEDGVQVAEKAIGGEVINAMSIYTQLATNYQRSVLQSQVKRVKLLNVFLDHQLYDPDKADM